MGDEFLWGASIAPHQVEGGNTNNWTQWEASSADELAAIAEDRFGELPVWEDIRNSATDPGNYRSEGAVAHAERYTEDFSIAEDHGLNAVRTGIEWSRVQPEPGYFDEDAFQHYRTYLEAMHDHGLEPVITLWHYSLPTWFVEAGGWHGDEAVEHYTAYVDRVVEELGDFVTYWVTMNEPAAYLRGYGGVKTVMEHVLPPEQVPRGPDPVPDTDPIIDYHPFKKRAARNNLLAAHRNAYDRIHAQDDDAMVGTANAVGRWRRADDGAVARLLGRFGAWIEYGSWVDATREHIDFIGVNHFVPTDLDALLPWRDRYDTSDMGWPVDPGSLRDVLHSLERYDLPILVTEHGVADRSDVQRQQLIDTAVTDITALQEDYDLIGYLHWSLLDNFEWDKGFWPRWGLIRVDHDNGLERIPRDSMAHYRDSITADRQ